MVRGQHASLAGSGAECAVWRGEEPVIPDNEQLGQEYAETNCSGGCSSEERGAKVKDVAETGENKEPCRQNGFKLGNPAQPEKSICLRYSGWKR
jgi:hypothetical protein